MKEGKEGKEMRGKRRRWGKKKGVREEERWEGRREGKEAQEEG